MWPRLLRTAIRRLTRISRGAPRQAAGTIGDLVDARALIDRLHRRGIERDRTTARAIHDDPLQSIIAGERQLGGAPSPDGIAAARAHLRDAIDALRAIGSDLHPPELDHADLATALTRLATITSARTDTTVTFSTSGPRPPHRRERDARLYRAVECALESAIENRHAKTVEIALTVGATGGQTLRLHDDGASEAFDWMAREDRLCMLDIREHVESIKGSLHIARPAVGGLAIVIHVIGDAPRDAR